MTFYHNNINLIILFYLLLFANEVFSQDYKPRLYTEEFYKINYIKEYSNSPLNKLLKSYYDIEKNTQLLQSYIEKHDTIILPNREIIISEKGIDLRDNNVLIFQDKTRLRIAPNNMERNGLISVINKKNVAIYNAYLIGDRYKHTSNKGEWGMGIRILGSENVVVDNFYIQDMWGDGIYVGKENYSDSRNKKNYSRNIKITNGVVNNNRRNGISITSAIDLYLDNILASNSNGVGPAYGFDFEPNNSNEEINYINVGKVFSKNNVGGGLRFTLNKLGNNNKRTKEIRIDVDSFYDTGSHYGLFINRLNKNALNIEGFINFNKVIVEDNIKPIMIKQFETENFLVDIRGFDIRNPKNKNFNNQEVLRTLKLNKQIKVTSIDEKY